MMRKYALIKDEKIIEEYGYRRLILDAIENERVYLYYSFDEDDLGSAYDDYCEQLGDAYESAEAYGIKKEDWIDLEEPREGCFRNFQRPVRWSDDQSTLLVLKDNKWIDLKLSKEDE